jgi:hypothetical protein
MYQASMETDDFPTTRRLPDVNFSLQRVGPNGRHRSGTALSLWLSEKGLATACINAELASPAPKYLTGRALSATSLSAPTFGPGVGRVEMKIVA